MSLGFKHLQEYGYNLISRLFPSQNNNQRYLYEDFDTDEEEDLDMTPEWLMNRLVLLHSLEDVVKLDSQIISIPLYSSDQEPAQFKCIVLRDSKKRQRQIQQIEHLMKERAFLLRLYILEGQNIESKGLLFIKIKLNSTLLVEREYSCEMAITSSPQFYYTYESTVRLPGPAILLVQVWEESDIDKLLGETRLDLEDRYLSRNWRSFLKKPVEVRTIHSPLNQNMGQLKLLLDLTPLEFQNYYQHPQQQLSSRLNITRPTQSAFELRLVVYSVSNVVFQPNSLRDLYVRCFPQGQSPQQTDTHSRLKPQQTASFNWRMKWTLNFPLRQDSDYGSDRLLVQLWDQNILTNDQLIAEAIIDLNSHKLISKACKRDKTINLLMRLSSHGGQVTNEIWYDLYNPKYVDIQGHQITQAKILISIQLMPLQESLLKLNAIGRNQPNEFPHLDSPKGRFKFDLLNPISMLNQFIGPQIAKKIFYSIIAFILTFVFGYMLWVLITQGLIIAIFK